MGHPLRQRFNIDLTDETIIIEDESGDTAEVDSGSLQTISTSLTPDGDSVSTVSSGISTGNSTESALGADGTFTGSWVDVEQWDAIRLTVKSDQQSAAAGVRIQWSTDGNAVDSETAYTYPPGAVGSSRVFVDPTEYQYVRVVYDNGSTAQGSFFLRTFAIASQNQTGAKSVGILPDEEEVAGLDNAQLFGREGNTGDFQFVEVVSNRLLGRAQVQNSTGTLVDPATAALEDALSSNGSDSFQTDLIDIGGQAQSAVDVANKLDQLADALATAFDADDELRTDLITDSVYDGITRDHDGDTADETARAVDAAVRNSAGDVIDPFDQADVGQISATDSGTGSASAATLSLGDFRKDVDIFVDTSGAATLTVEVSEDGGTTWRTLDVVDYQAAATEVEQYQTAFADIRAFLDQNRNEVVAVSRGV